MKRFNRSGSADSLRLWQSPRSRITRGYNRKKGISEGRPWARRGGGANIAWGSGDGQGDTKEKVVFGEILQGKQLLGGKLARRLPGIGSMVQCSRALLPRGIERGQRDAACGWRGSDPTPTMESGRSIVRSYEKGSEDRIRLEGIPTPLPSPPLCLPVDALPHSYPSYF